MGEPYSILTVLDQPILAREGISKIIAFLSSRGAKIDNECYFFLYDTPEKEFDVEDSKKVTDLSAALETISAWPVLGSMEYRLFGGDFVQFHTRRPLYLEAASLSISRASYLKNQQQILHFCFDLHFYLRSRRTIVGWFLTEDFDWKEEVERVSRHEYKESRDLDLDLKFIWFS